MRNVVSIAFLSVLLLSAKPAMAQERLLPACKTNTDKTKVICDLRFSDPRSFPRAESVGVKWLPSGKTDTAKFNSFDLDRDKVAWLFLVDRSGSMNKGFGKTRKSKKLTVTEAAIRKDLKRLVRDARKSSHLVGIATFAEDLDMIARIGASSRSLDDAIDEIKLTGKRTALFARTKEALTALANFQGARRRSLVILTDGISEDPESEYLKKNVINLARNKGIVIYSVFYRNPDKPLTFETLARLSSRTNGDAVKVHGTKRTMPNEFVDTFFDVMGNGGFAEFDVKANKDGSPPRFEITTFLQGNRTLSSNELVLASRVERAGGILGWWYSQSDKMKYIIGGGAGLAVVLLGLLAGLLMRKRATSPSTGPSTGEYLDQTNLERQAATATSGVGTFNAGLHTEPLSTGAPSPVAAVGAGAGVQGGATKILGNGGGTGSGQNYAWLVRTDTSERIPIQETTVRIGRHEDNDLQFSEESIHRRHAVLHMTPQREFIITNLSGPNGNKVEVNSNAVDKHELKDGDLIKLGTVTLRFQIPTV